MNTLTRDEVISRGLDQVDSPRLNQLERPGGVLSGNAMSISWLSECVSYMNNRFPWAAGITRTTYTLVGTDTYALPSDFILDVRDGLKILDANQISRLRRKKLQWLLNHDTASTNVGRPEGYVILPPNLRVWRTPDRSYSAEFWYYAMPAQMFADTVPQFPDDWVLVKYVALAGKEWTGEQPPGTAMNFAIAAANGLRQSGLGSEPEEDALQPDPTFFRPTGSGDGGWTSGWMGDTIPNNG